MRIFRTQYYPGSVKKAQRAVKALKLARKKYPKDGDRLAAMLYYTNTRRTQ
jgi:hypothetical protein